MSKGNPRINTSVSKLPFITAPKVETIEVGNERTGTLEFPVYNDLTVTESAWLQANGATKTAFSYTSKTALVIARAEKAKPIDCHQFVSKILAAAMGAQLELTDKEQTWSVKYVRELEECAMHVLEVTVAAQNILVTCLIRHRLTGMDDWAPSDTSNMPSELCELIYNFGITEQNRGDTGTTEEAVEELTELLGKSQTEPTKGQSRSTGQKRSTKSGKSIHQNQTSAVSDSGA